MGAINRSVIMEIIRRQGPISRTSIAQRLEVSLPTAMRIAEELIEARTIRAQGSTEESGRRQRSIWPSPCVPSWPESPARARAALHDEPAGGTN
jgi:hypothetical protein